MVASVDGLLQAAAEVRRMCGLLLALRQAFNDGQRKFIEKTAQNAVRFSETVVDVADILESGSYQIRGMSFELRTPVAAMRGFSDLLLMGVAGSLTEAQSEIVKQLQDAAKKLGALVDDLFNSAAPWPDT